MELDSTTLTKLASIGCVEPWQVLHVLPKEHADCRSVITTLDDGLLGGLCLYQAKIRLIRKLDRFGQITRSPYPAKTEFVVEMGCGTQMTVSAYGRIEEWLELKTGETFTFMARLDINKGTPQFRNCMPHQVTGKIEPIYTGAPGVVSGEVISQWAAKALADDDARQAAMQAIKDQDVVVDYLRSVSYGPGKLLTGLHKPDSVKEGSTAIRVARACVIEQVRSMGRATKPAEGPKYNIDLQLVAVSKTQPERLSQGQSSALNQIRRAINASCSARILLNGDVGSGKTLVFLLAAVACVQATQRPCAIMVPSELVANQIARQIRTRFPTFKTALLAGEIADPIDDAQIIVGTHAIIRGAAHLDLSLLVIDEQHKFSVEQRTALIKPSTHVIEASATPMPRSLALACFDGWTEARIDGCPVEKSIRCHLLMPDARQTVVQIVRKHLEASRKVFFLYPVVRNKDNSVIQAFERLEENLPGKVVAIHGDLKGDEKEKAIAQFASGEKPVAVVSTVIEVGVDVADVGCMVVSDADRFGVAQLHQLRGRLVRNGGVGDFVMMLSKEPSKATRQRLEAVKNTPDGFALAEQDMLLRGFGDVLGDSQHGSTQTVFKLARLKPEDFLS